MHIIILTFALVKGNILLACLVILLFLGLSFATGFGDFRSLLEAFAALLMNSWYSSVAWLIGWALILEYTIGGATVARGISPNLVCFPLTV